MKENNIRLNTKALSLVLAMGIAVMAPFECLAESKPKQGTFIEATMEDEVNYNKYIVKKGDNLSRISEKICKYYGEEISTQYWPAIAYLNEFPKIINPGDEIIFPATFEELVSLNKYLKNIKWTARYIQGKDIYGKKKVKQKTKLMDLLYDIYGDSVCIDEDFAYRYLAAVGLDGKYDAGAGEYTSEELDELTQWIPSIEDLGYKPQESTKKGK